VNASHRSMLLMAAFMALWVIIEGLGAASLTRAYSPFQIVWWRYGTHLLFMIAVWGWRNPQSLYKTSRPITHIVRSLLMLAMPASFIFALREHVSLAVGMSIFWLSPLLILAIAAVSLRERVSLWVWLACVAGWLGVVMVMHPSTPPVGAPLLLPFVMAVTFALYVVMTRVLHAERGHVNLFYTALGVFLALSPFMPAVWITPNGQDLLVLTGIGLLGYVALFALDRMAAAAPVSLSAPVAYVQVAFGVGVTFFVTHALLGRRTELGLFLILGAAVAAWIGTSRQLTRARAGAAA
jgi:drug/metabolite transporter (DMT)-like permease